MEKGNVLIMGNSGVGKSTLINSVLGKEVAKTSWGPSSTTSRIDSYENDEIPFRLIDTIGFEPSFIKEQKAINAVKKWTKDGVKEGKEEKKINVIWFCIEGTTGKLFPKTLKNLASATSIWKSVPVIIVITKSYSVPDREKNLEMVNKVLEKNTKIAERVRAVIPVVSMVYRLNDTAFAPVDGITELIDATNEALPEGIKAAEKDVSAYKLSRKRIFAQSVIGVSTASGAVIGAVPIPIADAFILTPLETVEINSIASIYGIKKTEKSKVVMTTIVEIGTVSLAAKAIISALKAIPGVNLAASVLNAIIAGSIVAAIGEGSANVFEKIYTGEKSEDDIEWITKTIEEKISKDLINTVKAIADKVSSASSPKEIADAIIEVFFKEKK